MSYKQILVQLDDNRQRSEKLAEVAVRLARDFAAQLVGVYIVPGLEMTPSLAAMLPDGIVAARLKIVVDELGPATASVLFEVGGGSTVRQGLHLDRHWRNIKTLSAHNPRNYKLRVIGDYELNGTPLPVGPFF